MGAQKSPLSATVTEKGQPTLSDAIRQHLGRLLASTYERACAGPDPLACLADLLSKLEDTLDVAERRDTAEFQASLLALVPALRRYALSLTHDRDAADDLVQETLMRAWRGRARFQIGTNFEGWTFTILRNRFYTTQTKLREFLDEDGAQAARLPSLPEQNGRLDLADLQDALAQLAAPMREALMLVTIEDLSYEETAARLSCRVGTVKSRIWRARAQLAQMLGYDGTEVGSDSVLLSAMEISA
jgi:RNA polymerase sigma-70 factor (ECF subfamily)